MHDNAWRAKGGERAIKDIAMGKGHCKEGSTPIASQGGQEVKRRCYIRPVKREGVW